MGSPSSETGRNEDEAQHVATLTHDFVILSTEVTQSEFEEVMGRSPSYFSECVGSCPVEMVSWWDAVAYVNALSERAGLPECYELMGCRGTPGGGCPDDRWCSGDYWCDEVRFAGLDCLGYRLPTEAEWEYAARAGTTTATYHGDLDEAHLVCESPNPVLDPIAWFCGNADRSTQETSTLEANDWGLYDMLGNASEWCHDWYEGYPAGAETDPDGPEAGSRRVLRGGSWGNDAGYARAARRRGFTPVTRYDSIGFRPSRSFP